MPSRSPDRRLWLIPRRSGCLFGWYTVMEPLHIHEDQYDEQEIARAIDLLFPPDSVIELRALKVPKGNTASGYFDGQHRKDLIVAAADLSGMAQGVYVTLNPVLPTLLARARNRVK